MAVLHRKWLKREQQNESPAHLQLEGIKAMCISVHVQLSITWKSKSLKNIILEFSQISKLSLFKSNTVTSYNN